MEETPITVTEQAAAQIKWQLDNRGTPDARLRLGVKGAGCSGFTYVILFDEKELREKDLAFESNGIKVVIDHKSIKYLNGSILDWENSLLKQGFKISNPHEKSKCGCGSSFSV